MTQQNLTQSGSPIFGGRPAFMAVLTSTQSNVTGDNTTVTVIPNSEIFDIGSNYNTTTGIFTAPVTGIYVFEISIVLDDLTAAHTQGALNLVTSNASYYLCDMNYGAIANPSGQIYLQQGGILVDMDAADTAYFTVVVSGSTKTVDINAFNRGTRFSGYRLL